MTRRAYNECDGPGCAVAVPTEFDSFMRQGPSIPDGWFFTFPEPMAEALAFCSAACVTRYEQGVQA